MRFCRGNAAIAINDGAINLCFSDGSTDIIDEALNYFKANVFFKSYEIKVLVFTSETLWFLELIRQRLI